MTRALERVLAEQELDLVQLEGVHLFGYLPTLRAARNRPILVCDWHNVESELMRRYGDWAESPWRRFYARETARRLAAVEREALLRLDAHVVVSNRDRDHLHAIAPEARAFVIENGVDVEHFGDGALDDAWRAAHPGRALPGDRRRVVFVGSMDDHANVDAARWFAEGAWPRLRARRPELTLTLVGRSPTAEVQALARVPGVEVTGTVDDVRPFYREAILSLVPLRVGGGSRLKILEAMAAGVPVVSTRLGAEGLEAQDGVDIRLADSEDALSAAAAQLAEDSAARAGLGQAGRALVRARYDWAALGEALRDAHAALVDARRRIFRVLAT
jgi:glycosyltransferase involved in cell wall biosynthesis